MSQAGIYQETGSTSSSGQTVGAGTADILTIPMGATAKTTTFFVKLASFESTTPAGGGYSLTGAIRTDGAAATLIGVPDKSVHEEAALVGTDANLIVVGNNAVVQVTGVGGLTINWSAEANAITAS